MRLLNNKQIIHCQDNYLLNSVSRRKQLVKWSWVGSTLIIAGILILVRPNLIEWLIGIAIIVIGVFYFLQAQR